MRCSSRAALALVGASSGPFASTRLLPATVAAKHRRSFQYHALLGLAMIGSSRVYSVPGGTIHPTGSRGNTMEFQGKDQGRLVFCKNPSHA
jgi:hypothetical protein